MAEEEIRDENTDDAIGDDVEIEERDEAGEGGSEEGGADEGQEEEPTEEEQGEVVVTIGDEEPDEEGQEDAPEWVRDLRKAHRELKRENRELEKKLSAMEAPEKPAELGAKPKLEDFDYDTDKYEVELASWYDRKREADERDAQQRAEQEEAASAWQGRMDMYEEQKAKLNVSGFDDAEAVVLDALNETQQGIIVHGADNPALVVLAIGKSANRAKELSEIKDPVKFAFAVAKLEKDMKVSNRKPPPPEKTVTGTGAKSGAVDSTLERLREKAAKTGDYSEVARYKRQKRQAS